LSHGGFAPTVADGGVWPLAFLFQRRPCADCRGRRLSADCLDGGVWPLAFVSTAALRRLLRTAAQRRVSMWIVHTLRRMSDRWFGIAALGSCR